MSSVRELCQKAKDNARYIAALSGAERNNMLTIFAAALIENSAKILSANTCDLNKYGDKNSSFYDRLRLDDKRISDMAHGIRELIKLPDPLGETIEEYEVKSGLKIQKVRVPFGVVGVIYEARPNVTADVISLCIKSGNSAVLRGGSDAECSNEALVAVFKASLIRGGYNPEFIQTLPVKSRESAEELMKCRSVVDVLIPRGSASLIKSVVENSLIPVIETGSGNCHAYVEKSADFEMAESIILNAKLSRPTVCNALEKLLIDAEAAPEFLNRIVNKLRESGVEVLACERVKRLCPDFSLASEDDFYTEFLSKKIAVKIVDGVDCAIEHINKYSTMHSETIITRDKAAAEKFLNGVDSAVVYVNASTRFTDGYEFGLGAEVGISTQKLHARGPFGIKGLTTYKYKVTGNGQIRQ